MSSAKATKKTLLKISRAEIELARGAVAWFACGDGETDIEHLALLHGLDADDLYVWAVGKRFMFRDSATALMEMLPAIWSDFSAKSRACLALHTALGELAATDRKVYNWEKGCYDRLRLWAAKREGKGSAA